MIRLIALAPAAALGVAASLLMSSAASAQACQPSPPGACAREGAQRCSPPAGGRCYTTKENRTLVCKCFTTPPPPVNRTVRPDRADRPDRPDREPTEETEPQEETPEG